MKHLVIRLAVSLFTFAVGIASFSLLHVSSTGSSAADERAILRVERQYIQAHLDGDIVALNNILADDFTFRSGPKVLNKADRLYVLDNPNYGFELIDTSNVQVSVEGDSATVTGEAYTRTRSYDMLSTSPPYSFTRRYEKRGGRWQIVSVTTDW